MELAEFINLLRKWKWLMLAIVAVVGVVTAVTSSLSATSYRSEATLVIGLSQITATSNSGLGIAQSGERISTTYAELVSSREVMEEAIKSAGLDMSPDALAGRVSAEAVKTTPVLKIAVTDTDPDRAILLTNEVARSFVSYIQSINTRQLEESQYLLDQELAEIEQALGEQTALPAPDAAEVEALQVRRAIVIDQIEALLGQQLTAIDLRISDDANSAAPIGVQRTQRMVIGIAISLIAAIAAAFVAEAVQGAKRWR